MQEPHQTNCKWQFDLVLRLFLCDQNNFLLPTFGWDVQFHVATFDKCDHPNDSKKAPKWNAGRISQSLKVIIRVASSSSSYNIQNLTQKSYYKLISSLPLALLELNKERVS